MNEKDKQFVEKLNVTMFAKVVRHSMAWSWMYDYVIENYPKKTLAEKSVLIREMMDYLEAKNEKTN